MRGAFIIIISIIIALLIAAFILLSIYGPSSLSNLPGSNSDNNQEAQNTNNPEQLSDQHESQNQAASTDPQNNNDASSESSESDQESPSSSCGNGVVEEGETCDGNVEQCIINGYPAYRPCSSDCGTFENCVLYPYCGDGICDAEELETRCSDCFLVGN